MKTQNPVFKFMMVLLVAFMVSCVSERVETQPADPVIIQKESPGVTYVLRGPEWRFDRTQKVYVYVPGEWVVRPSGIWVRGHWVKVKKGHKWVPGHWK
jgi:hypothetical protein